MNSRTLGCLHKTNSAYFPVTPGTPKSPKNFVRRVVLTSSDIVHFIM